MTKTVVDWTPERVELLTKMVHANASTREIMEATGAPSRSTVHGKIWRLGLSGMRPQHPQHANGRKPSAPMPKIRAKLLREPKRVLSKIFVRAKRKVDPCAPPAPIELPNPIPSSGPRACTILGLEFDSCRWPLGAFEERAKLYCGEQVIGCGPYCAAHAARAFVPLRRPEKKHAF